MERLLGHDVITEVDALMYVVLSKAEKHVPYGKLVRTIECIMLQTSCRSIRGCYNQVKLYIFLITFILATLLARIVLHDLIILMMLCEVFDCVKCLNVKAQ